MGNVMNMPETFEEFIKDYSFKDEKEHYTNGDELIQVFRVMQAWEHYKATAYKEEIIREENEKISYLCKKTGRGVFQCRKALSKNEWNVDKAIKWLNQFGDSHFYTEYKNFKETEGRTNVTE